MADHTTRLALANRIARVNAGGPNRWRDMPVRDRMAMVADALDELRHGAR